MPIGRLPCELGAIVHVLACSAEGCVRVVGRGIAGVGEISWSASKRRLIELAAWSPEDAPYREVLVKWDRVVT